MITLFALAISICLCLYACILLYLLFVSLLVCLFVCLFACLLDVCLLIGLLECVLVCFLFATCCLFACFVFDMMRAISFVCFLLFGLLCCAVTFHVCHCAEDHAIVLLWCLGSQCLRDVKISRKRYNALPRNNSCTLCGARKDVSC